MPFPSLILSLSLFWLPMSVAPVQATPCTLYQEESTPEALAAAEQQFEQQLQKQSNTVQAHCQLAHIHFKHAGAEKSEAKVLEHYRHCLDHTTAALRLDTRAAPAYFLKALCLGKKAELEGVWMSLEMIGPFEELMTRAAALDPSLDHGGPHRALGRYYHKLPWLLGGSLDKSINHLKQAVRLSPDHWQNLLFLAEAYHDNNQNAEARDTLLKLMDLTRPRAHEADLSAPLKRARALLNQIQTETGSP